MSDDGLEKINITAGDLSAKSVDEALSQQMSFGTPAPAKLQQKTAWYYQSWFVLMIAGAVGAFAAWGMLEPSFDDGIRFRGNVEEVDGSAILADKVAGRMKVSGNNVWFVKTLTKSDVGKGLEELEVGAFERGQVIEVSGEAVEVAPMTVILAHRVTLIRGDRTTHAPVDVEALSRKHLIVALIMFPLVACFVGMFIGAADGLISRAYGRAVISALVGLGMGLVVGVVMTIAGNICYAIFSALAQKMDTSEAAGKMSTGAFILQMMGRGISWALLGMAMGMGQGVALRSKKLFINGLLGGVVGGLLGGLLFDPINYICGGGEFGAGAELSRMIGITFIGAVTGLMIGIVELIAREAWLKMLAGPLAGKEFILYKDPTTIGSSPKREVYLFKDPAVEPVHALIKRVGEGYEIEDQKTPGGTHVNGRKVTRQRLKSQDQIRIGTTVLLFTMKEE